MRVGLVRSVALGMVALVGFAGCDDNPTDFDTSDTASITTNPSAMTVNAGETALLDSRTINAGDEPTWEEISATVDGSCGHSDISVATAATYEPSIQPPGQFDVTGGTTVGESCVQLSGGGASATVEVTVVADSLDITGVPEGDMIVGDEIQLGGNIIADDGSVVSPFDFATDVVWASDDSAVAVVDESGVLSAVGAGGATITATWTGFGVSRTYEFSVNVIAPPPVLSSTDVAAAAIGEMVTVTATGILPTAHSIFVDGLVVDEILEPTLVNSTTATFLMPPGPDGPAEIQIGVAGDLSNTLTVDRSGTTEPDNNSTATAPMVTFPVDEWGFTPGGGDLDFFQFTLAVETTFSLFLDWRTDADMDLYVTDVGFNFALCGFAAGTANQPESGECTLAAGTYWLAVVSYDGGAATWRMMVDEVTP